MSESVIRSRIDSAIKLEAQSLLSKFGLSMSDAIRLFLHQVVMEKGLPFAVRLPEEAAKEHDRWFRLQVEAALKKADNPKADFTPHDSVHARWNRKRKELQSRVGKADKG